jgi:hypothetical protein
MEKTSRKETKSQVNAFQLIDTIHDYRQNLPIAEGELICMKCDHHVHIKDLDSDASLCHTAMTKPERTKYIQDNEWAPFDKVLLTRWFGTRVWEKI